jgi:Domain of unknown function (DUF4288)
LPINVLYIQLAFRDAEEGERRKSGNWGSALNKVLKRMEMANSPEVSRWYIAELTEEVTLEGDPKHVIHRKTRVIFADSAEDAYEKALSMITEHELNYLNEHQKAVRTRFWGLRELELSNEDMDRAGILPQERIGAARRKNSTGLSPEQQFALMVSVKPGARPN